MLRDTLTRLQMATEGCHRDMHEPDEQGVSAIVIGDHLDNAIGGIPDSAAYTEFAVGISRDGGRIEWFNLADVIALARLAKLD